MGNCVRTLSFGSDSSFGSEYDLKVQEAVPEESFHTPRMYNWPVLQNWPSLEAATRYLLKDFKNLESEEVKEACLYVKKELIRRKPEYFDKNTKLSPPHKKNNWKNHWVFSKEQFQGVFIVAAKIVDFTLISQWLVYIDGDYIDLCEFKEVGSTIKKKNILQ